MKQPGGRGALYAGGVPGNRGGGRLPSEVKRLALDGFADNVETLRQIAGSWSKPTMCEGCGGPVELPVSASEAIRAIDVMAKYGMSEPKSGLDHEKIRTIAHVLEVWLLEYDFTITREMGKELLDRWADALDECR